MTPRISFEVFPPNSLKGSFHLWETISALAPLGPDYVSVTYGAGGSTRDRTHEAVTAITGHTGLPVAAHLTCVDASRSETLEIAARYREAGITHLVALRGDMPCGGPFEPHPDGFQTTCDLVEALAGDGFHVRVGAYPEVHPDAETAQSDIDWLKAKLGAGAIEAVTQFFFDPEVFLRFRDACAVAGIDQTIVPGILPIANWHGAVRFAKRCGASIPDDLKMAFEKALRDDRHDLLAIAQATELCDTLLSEGVGQLHFYTLNRPDLTRQVCHALGVVEDQKLRHVA